MAAVEAGATVLTAVDRCEVSPRTGSVSPDKIGGQCEPLPAPKADLTAELTANNKSILLVELGNAVLARGTPRVDLSTLWQMLRLRGLHCTKGSR